MKKGDGKVTQTMPVTGKYLLLTILLVSVLLALILTSTSGYGAKNAASTMTPEESTLTLQNVIDPSATAMKFHRGKLTVRITSTPLRQVMQDLGRVTGARVSWKGQEITKKVSVQFMDLPLDKAIARILRGESYVLSYTSAKEESKLDTIIIWPCAKGGKEPVATAQAIPEAVMFEKVDKPTGGIGESPEMELVDDETRNCIESVRAVLMEGDTEQAAEGLVLALTRSAKPQVRMLALEGLRMLSAPPLDAIIETALYDPEPMVRRHAARCLEMHVDEDPRVKEIVSEVAQKEKHLQEAFWNGHAHDVVPLKNTTRPTTTDTRTSWARCCGIDNIIATPVVSERWKCKYLPKM